MTKMTYVNEKVTIESIDDHKNLPDTSTLTPLQEFLMKENREEVIKRLNHFQFAIFILKEYGFENNEIGMILNCKMQKVYRINFKIRAIREEIAKK